MQHRVSSRRAGRSEDNEMPQVAFDLPQEVMDALDRQARALLLSRRVYLRALLASVAAFAERKQAQKN